jgi:hypothetical protein
MLSLVISLALAQHWEANGVTGKFGSADAACKAAYGADSTLEFVPPARKPDSENPDNIFRECWYRTKGESTADGGNAPVKMTIASFYPAKDDDPDQEQKADAGTAAPAKKSRCDASTNFSFFPSIAKSKFSKHAGTMVADTSPGSCMMTSQKDGGRLFTGSGQTVKADRMRKQAQPVGEHYFLRVGNVIIDPTFLQFFDVGDAPGLIFAGTDAQLVAAANKLFKLCGPNPATNDSKDGASFKAANFDGAKVCNAGSTLTVRPESGIGEYANAWCD